MKKIFLSSLLTLSFVGYVTYQRLIGFDGGAAYYVAPSAGTENTTTTPVATEPAPSNPQPVPVSRPRRGEDDGEYGEEGVRPVFVPPNQTGVPVVKKVTPPPTPVVTPTPAPTPAVTNSGLYRNGTYTGNVADAYYGNVQVKVIISNGKISDVQFLDYPQDRSNSIRINTYAMPILTSEAIQAQSANVNGVSGATATSGAFRESLANALTQAKN